MSPAAVAAQPSATAAAMAGPGPEPQRVTVVGGGLVGSLCACLFAQKGYEVDLYEFRQDPRLSSVSRGRSINLAMSQRARAALALVGLEGELLRHGLPMRARMIHGLDGSMRDIPYDPRTNQCIYSVGRKFLNDILLSAAEQKPNIRLHFGHKMTGGDLDEGRIQFESRPGDGAAAATVEAVADLVVGCDGAYSAVRRLFMKKAMFNFSQTYIEHGYMELRIPPTADGDVRGADDGQRAARLLRPALPGRRAAARGGGAGRRLLPLQAAAPRLRQVPAVPRGAGAAAGRRGTRHGAVLRPGHERGLRRRPPAGGSTRRPGRRRPPRRPQEVLGAPQPGRGGHLRPRHVQLRRDA